MSAAATATWSKSSASTAKEVPRGNRDHSLPLANCAPAHVLGACKIAANDLAGAEVRDGRGLPPGTDKKHQAQSSGLDRAAASPGQATTAGQGVRCLLITAGWRGRQAPARSHLPNPGGTGRCRRMTAFDGKQSRGRRRLRRSLCFCHWPAPGYRNGDQAQLRDDAVLAAAEQADAFGRVGVSSAFTR